MKTLWQFLLGLLPGFRDVGLPASAPDALIMAEALSL
jgi:hypothetical protein